MSGNDVDVEMNEINDQSGSTDDFVYQVWASPGGGSAGSYDDSSSASTTSFCFAFDRHQKLCNDAVKRWCHRTDGQIVTDSCRRQDVDEAEQENNPLTDVSNHGGALFHRKAPVNFIDARRCNFTCNSTSDSFRHPSSKTFTEVSKPACTMANSSGPPLVSFVSAFVVDDGGRTCSRDAVAHDHFINSTLSDTLLSRVFSSGLDSIDLCRCAAVCRRWYSIVWNACGRGEARTTIHLWRSIVVRGPFDADRGIRSLTRLIGGGSRGPMTVCVGVERLVVDGRQSRLTDRGLQTAARCCPELRRLELPGCELVTDVGVGYVVSRCASLQHVDLTGKFRTMKKVITEGGVFSWVT